jgi:photosystem II stability/assembly factor-like uncharacterized protein
VSPDGGRSWKGRAVPEPLVALVLDPNDPDRLLASGERSLYVSQDAGRRWRSIEGPAGLVAWSSQVVVVAGDGEVSRAKEPEARLQPIGDVGGRPAALEAGPQGELYVALHDGTVKRSSDGGRNWDVRSRP